MNTKHTTEQIRERARAAVKAAGVIASEQQLDRVTALATQTTTRNVDAVISGFVSALRSPADALLDACREATRDLRAKQIGASAKQAPEPEPLTPGQQRAATERVSSAIGLMHACEEHRENLRAAVARAGRLASDAEISGAARAIVGKPATERAELTRIFVRALPRAPRKG